MKPQLKIAAVHKDLDKMLAQGAVNAWIVRQNLNRIRAMNGKPPIDRPLRTNRASPTNS